MTDKWEVNLLVEYLEEFIVAVSKGIDDQSTEQGMDIINTRKRLIDHICEELRIEND